MEPPQSPPPVPYNVNGIPASEYGDGDGEGDMTVQEVPIENVRSRLWSGKDLEMVCLQNSAVVVALSALRVGLGAHANGNGVPGLQRQGSGRRLHS